MARKFLTALDLNKNELQNGVVQNLGTAPSSPVKGQLYFNSTGGDNTLYWYDGVGWVPAKASGGAFPGYGTVPAETSYGIAKADGAATTVARSDHTHGSPALPTHNALTATADVAFSGFKLTGVGTPTVGTDATTKDYVDARVAGLSWKSSAQVATTANITLSGAGQTIDGFPAIAFTRVLVKNQTTPSQNGIYDVQSGAWTRATDADIASEFVSQALFVQAGTVNADTAWVCTVDQLGFTLGSSPVVYVQFSGSGVVVGGAGLTLTGNTLDVVGDASIVVGADSITRAALSGAVTAPIGSNVTTIPNNSLSNLQLQNVPSNTIKGNNTAIGPPLDLTAAQVKTLLAIANTDVSGLGPFAPSTKTTIVSADITDGTVANNDLAAMPANTFKGNNTGSSAAPQDVTVAALKTALGVIGKFAQATIGGATSQVVTHNLNTQAVVTSVYRTLTPWDVVDCDIENTSVNTVTLRFAVAPAANEYSCVVVG